MTITVPAIGADRVGYLVVFRQDQVRVQGIGDRLQEETGRRHRCR